MGRSDGCRRHQLVARLPAIRSAIHQLFRPRHGRRDGRDDESGQHGCGARHRSRHVGWNGGFNPLHNTLGAPADGKRVVSVGAVDSLGLRAAFSSVGPTADGRIKPDVAALGVRAKVAGTATVSAYGLASGTSFSCPLTAGVVALLLQAHPTYTVDQVLLALRSTASQHGEPDILLGWGLVDAVAAVDTVVPAITASTQASQAPVLRPSMSATR